MSKTHGKTITKAHKIGRSVGQSGSAKNPYAVGMAVAKRAAASRKAKR